MFTRVARSRLKSFVHASNFSYTHDCHSLLITYVINVTSVSSCVITRVSTSYFPLLTEV